MLALLNPAYGKIRRRTWWFSQIVIFMTAFLGLMVTVFLFADPVAASGGRSPAENAGIFSTLLAMLYMNLCSCLNRLRESGRSGLWYLSFLLPAAGTGLMVYFCGIEKHPGRFTSPGLPDKGLQRAV